MPEAHMRKTCVLNMYKAIKIWLKKKDDIKKQHALDSFNSNWVLCENRYYGMGYIVYSSGSQSWGSHL